MKSNLITRIENTVSAIKTLNNPDLNQLVESDFNWRNEAQKLLQQRAIDLILKNLTEDELDQIALGNIDINEYYKSL